MRVARPIYRKITVGYDIYSLDILDTATETLTVSAHNVEIDTVIKQYYAVDIV